MPGTNSNPPQGQLSSVLAHNKVKCTARNCCQLSQQPSAISHDNHILRYYYCRGPPSPTKLESKSQPTFSRGNCLPLPMQSSASGASEVTGNFHVSWPAGGSGAGWPGVQESARDHHTSQSHPKDVNCQLGGGQRG